MSNKMKTSNSKNNIETESKSNSKKILSTENIGSPTLTDGQFYVFN